MHGPFLCELVDHMVVARLQGQPTEAVLEECQAEILSLVRAAGVQAVLYDFRQLSFPPSAKVMLHQEALEQETHGLKLRRAVVAPNTSIGYLARLAFSADDCLVFLNDYAAAVRFLSEGSPSWSAWSLAVGEERRFRERRCRVDRSRQLMSVPRTSSSSEAVHSPEGAAITG